MKQKDIALIVVVCGISAIISLFVSKAIFPAKSRQTKAEVVQAIDATFPQLDPKYFNNNSVNPTTTIKIGGTPTNNNPFSGGSH